MAIETSIAWGRGTKSYFALDYRNKVDDKIGSPQYGFWVEAPSGEKVYEPLMGLLLLQSLALLGSRDITHSVHVMKQDDERITPENDFNAPFRFTDGKWTKGASNEQMVNRIVGYGLLALLMIQKRNNEKKNKTSRQIDDKFQITVVYSRSKQEKSKRAMRRIKKRK